MGAGGADFWAPLWTPEGDYDGSPGADDLLGFWTDEGEGRVPTFVPASKLAAEHSSPSKITEALR